MHTRSVQKRTSSLSSGRLTPNLTLCPPPPIGGLGGSLNSDLVDLGLLECCRCYRSMLNSLYGHLFITHSALPHRLTEFTVPRIRSLSSRKLISNLIKGLVLSHLSALSMNAHDLCGQCYTAGSHSTSAYVSWVSCVASCVAMALPA